MFLIRLLREAVSIYAILMLVYFILPFATSNQRPWMATLARICAPGVRVGNQLAARLLPDRQLKLDVGPLFAILLCWVIRWVTGLFV